MACSALATTTTPVIIICGATTTERHNVNKTSSSSPRATIYNTRDSTGGSVGGEESPQSPRVDDPADGDLLLEQDQRTNPWKPSALISWLINLYITCLIITAEPLSNTLHSISRRFCSVDRRISGVTRNSHLPLLSTAGMVLGTGFAEAKVFYATSHIS